MLWVGLIFLDVILSDSIISLRPLQEPPCLVHDVFEDDLVLRGQLSSEQAMGETQHAVKDRMVVVIVIRRRVSAHAEDLCGRVQHAGSVGTPPRYISPHDLRCVKCVFTFHISIVHLAFLTHFKHIMLDSFEILTTSGVVLWSKSYNQVSPSIINSFIKDVFIEDTRVTGAGASTDTTSARNPTYKKDKYTLKWTTAKDLGLIFVVSDSSLGWSRSRQAEILLGCIPVVDTSFLDR